MDKLKLLSLFSGIGAFEKGIFNLGVEYDLVAFSEFDNHAAKSYSLIHNVPESMNLGDINLINEKQLPDFDLMTYGFPCQSFSKQGKRLGFDDPEKGNLFFESMRMVRKKKPKYMIAENVKGLAGHDKGNTFKTIISTLEWLGYNNYYRIISSSNFGIPHFRERVFIVSIRKDIDKQNFKFSEGKPTNLKVKDFIDWNEQKREITPSLRPYFDEKYHKKFLDKNGLIKVFDGCSQGYFTSGFSTKRVYSIEGYCPTLTVDKRVFFKEIMGSLSPKERFRLQGFSDEDYFKVKDYIPESELIKQTGNSITVNVIQSILENLLISQEELITYNKNAI